MSLPAEKFEVSTLIVYTFVASVIAGSTAQGALAVYREVFIQRLKILKFTQKANKCVILGFFGGSQSFKVSVILLNKIFCSDTPVCNAG